MNNKEKAESRLGETNVNHQGLEMIIIKYNNSILFTKRITSKNCRII